MRLGLERLLENPKRWLGNARIGLIANPTSVDRQLNHAVDLMHRHRDIDLRLLFGPEHGLRGCAQDMAEVDDARDPATGLSEISLYGDSFNSLSPTSEHLSQIDMLVFDIQDVGARYYTYAATMALCMRAAKSHQVKMVVLDRPNPIGGVQIEGGGVEAGLESFCGLYPIPQRHAMTIGELARLYNATFGIGGELEVVECEGWYRAAYYDDCDLPWIMPSPNLPTLDSAIVYPGTCLLEGTNLSEGRGTTRPFELIGAPFIDAPALTHELSHYALSGVRFRPCVIEPVFHKFARQRCQALQLHVTDRRAFDAYRTGIALLVAVKSLWPNDFTWRTDPYEFRDDVPAIDLLAGTPLVRAAIDDGKDLDRVMRVACTGTELYDAGRSSALLYG